MVKIGIVIFLFVTSSAFADDTRARIAHIRDLVAKQKVELDDTKAKLLWTWDELGRAETQIQSLDKERNDWHAYGDDQHNKFMNAEKRVAEGKAGLLRRDILIGGLTLAIGVFVYLKFFLHIPFL